MAKVRIDLPELHPAQQEIFDHAARFKVLACGRRFGKTTVAVKVICSHLLAGKSVAYFAPTFRMTKDVWEDLKSVLAPVTKRVSEHDFRLELHTGGMLECWSLMAQAGETVRVVEQSDRWIMVKHPRGNGWTERAGVGVVD